jgi:hypothetical protein
MDKVIIFGTYHFMGFSLCQELLELGIEVSGFRWAEDSIEENLEEKRLLIGRNANFKESQLDDFENDKIASIIISYYDLYYSKMANPDKIFEQSIPIFNQFSKSITNIHILFLLPMIYIKQIPETLKKYFNNLNQMQIPYQIIFLPTIFGPWQSSVFLFQKYLQSNERLSDLNLDEREWTLDAIYVKDATKEIIKLMNGSEPYDYILKSTLKNQWIAGARYLQLERYFSEIPQFIELEVKEKVKVITVKESIKIEDGLNKQKKHFKKLQC